MADTPKELKDMNFLEKSGMGLIGLIVVLILIPLLLPFSLYYGWGMSVIWNMLAVPMFHLPNMSMANGTVLMFIIGYLKQSLNTEEKPKAKHPWLLLFNIIFTPL